MPSRFANIQRQLITIFRSNRRAAGHWDSLQRKTKFSILILSALDTAHSTFCSLCASLYYLTAYQRAAVTQEGQTGNDRLAFSMFHLLLSTLTPPSFSFYVERSHLRLNLIFTACKSDSFFFPYSWYCSLHCCAVKKQNEWIGHNCYFDWGLCGWRKVARIAWGTISWFMNEILKVNRLPRMPCHTLTLSRRFLFAFLYMLIISNCPLVR